MEKPPIQNIETRQPVLDQELSEIFSPEKMDKQWRWFTEVVRKNILTDPKVREYAASHATSPVDESLPKIFFEGLLFNDKVANLKEDYKDDLVRYLELESVPDEQIKPDVSHAELLPSPKRVIELLQESLGIDTPEFYRELKQYVDSGTFLRGITVQERLMIIQRYRFARDVKMLALQAEVSGVREGVQINDRGEVTLPSGTTININLEDETKRQELLNPQNWQKRRQLKDRIYEIQVGSSRYILKERKTARHKDTTKGGHRPGLTSLEEYQTARYFQENEVVENGCVKVNWEKPVASVTFPDSFQFTIFEHEAGFIEGGKIYGILVQQILAHREQFEEEFATICAMARKFKDDPRVVSDNEDTEFGLTAILRWVGLKKEQIPDLTFEEFAAIKALRMQRQARSLMEETIIKNGYENSDVDGYSYKINSRGGKPQLEIFGFDFEYFSKIDPSKIEETLKRHRDSKREEETTHGIGLSLLDNGDPVTRMQGVAYFAMLMAEGLFETQQEY